MSKKNVIVAQSGGPTVAINASLAGVLDASLKNEAYETVYGSVYGILGILEDRLMNLNEQVEKNPDFIET
ncbi:MAG: 6-phosphofructokinase, partial [Lachnospiraceae bacterium]|nr:6-phosphofructokinase [Lachnospiraceae bacterium]